jgi:hypothetical protein
MNLKPVVMAGHCDRRDLRLHDRAAKRQTRGGEFGLEPKTISINWSIDVPQKI